MSACDWHMAAFFGIIDAMKTINTSIFDFPELIKGGFVYVDKTAQLYEFAKPDAGRGCSKKGNPK